MFCVNMPELCSVLYRQRVVWIVTVRIASRVVLGKSETTQNYGRFSRQKLISIENTNATKAISELKFLFRRRNLWKSSKLPQILEIASSQILSESYSSGLWLKLKLRLNYFRELWPWSYLWDSVIIPPRVLNDSFYATENGVCSEESFTAFQSHFIL